MRCVVQIMIMRWGPLRGLKWDLIYQHKYIIKNIVLTSSTYLNIYPYFVMRVEIGGPIGLNNFYLFIYRIKNVNEFDNNF